ncbi:MAG TPA: hypothetical protein VK978_02235, partial [Candidatus Saccharimonadales bacterium]|nr:hypothetical protein [Candidatus Saccharimonadales bacterium]
MKTPDILSNPNFRRAFVVAAAVAIANFPQDQAHAEPSDPTPSVIDVSSGSDNSDSPSGRSRDSKKYTPVPSVIPVSGN